MSEFALGMWFGFVVGMGVIGWLLRGPVIFTERSGEVDTLRFYPHGMQGTLSGSAVFWTELERDDDGTTVSVENFWEGAAAEAAFTWSCQQWLETGKVPVAKPQGEL